MATISQVIAALQAALVEHGDLPVEVEGCDCYGDARGTVKVYPNPFDKTSIALIERD